MNSAFRLSKRLVVLFLVAGSMGHFNFSDKCLLLNGPIPQRSDTIGKIDKRRGLSVAAVCIATFFDVHLKGAQASLIEALPSKFPELVPGPETKNNGQPGDK